MMPTLRMNSLGWLLFLPIPEDEQPGLAVVPTYPEDEEPGLAVVLLAEEVARQDDGDGDGEEEGAHRAQRAEPRCQHLQQQQQQQSCNNNH